MDDDKSKDGSSKPEGFPEHPESVPSEAEMNEMVFGVSDDEFVAARQLLREGLVPAVKSIVHIAQHSSNDRTRADASKYVIERNLGKVADKLALGDHWDSLLGEIIKDKG